jgi:hypothetical protein
MPKDVPRCRKWNYHAMGEVGLTGWRSAHRGLTPPARQPRLFIPTRPFRTLDVSRGPVTITAPHSPARGAHGHPLDEVNPRHLENPRAAGGGGLL